MMASSHASKKKGKKRLNIFHRPPPGSSPGTLVAPLNPNPTQIVITAYDEQDFACYRTEDAPQLQTIKEKYKVTWISVSGFGNLDLIQSLCRDLGIHRLTLENIINSYQRPKVEYFDRYAYITVQLPKIEALLESEHISLIVGEGFVLSFQTSQAEYLEAIRNRILKKIGQIRMKGADYLAYAMIDAVIDLYFPVAEYYAQKLEQAEEEIINALKPTAVLDIYRTGSKLNYYHRILWSHKEMLNQLVRDPESPIGDDVTVYLRDCLDHTMQVLDFLENLRDTSKTLIHLHLSLQSHNSNEIMKFLTIITATFIPMTFITGLYGMNFNRDSPFNMPELDWAYGYPFALLMMVISAGCLWLYFLRRRWVSTQMATKDAIEGELSKPQDRSNLPSSKADDYAPRA